MQKTINIINSKTEWDNAIARMKIYDFYFTYDYHKLSVQEPNKFILLSFKSGNYEILLPLVIRPIPETLHFDATSVYGYVGPLTSHKIIPDKILAEYHNSLNHLLKELNIVSLFSRLHPYIENNKYIINHGEIVSLSETVYINLQQPLETQYKQYRKGVKSDIKKLIREEYEVIEDNELEYLDDFVEIYTENMERVNASNMYFFPVSYFKRFLTSKEIGAKLYVVKKDNIVAGGSIIVFSNSIIQYHLSGTRIEYMKNSPIRLVLDTIRKENTEKQYAILHLGGGVGSAIDSLFNFKAGFSKERLSFKIWKYIVNETMYKDLCKKAKVDESEDYFPQYRAINKVL